MSATASGEEEFEAAYVVDSVGEMPTTFKSAMESSNAAKWKDACDSEVLRVAGFWYCVPVTGQPKPVQSEPTLITPPRITPLLIMPPVGTRL
ncbi:unnamed protein product [Phytophthora lilii]|uniref:Unnamed protein product n=1 Tax=Phytophthora lilii TaxID=2077276 RepID=A0A9W7CWZ8_9STRA|nr:unnamed protein product [Phytophthora lilii]